MYYYYRKHAMFRKHFKIKLTILFLRGFEEIKGSSCYIKLYVESI